MKDVIMLIAVFVIGYMSFLLVVFFLGKLIFPFLTEEELKRRNTLINLKRS